MNSRRIRVGAVNYLNTKPLVYDLASLAPQAEVIFDLPSRLANRLASGDLDVALVPSIDYLQNPDYEIVSDACIACRGPVLSVKLFFRTPPEQVRRLALDAGSHTSAVLAQILLSERHGVTPQLVSLPIGQAMDDTSADAVLLIGDRAIHSPSGRFAEVWDLGDVWCRWTELPFVFAMWAARAGTDLGGIATALAAARDRGTANVEEIAAREAAPLGLTRPQCVAYLSENLHFHLGQRESCGLELFREKANRLRPVLDPVQAAPFADLGRATQLLASP
jgi:chorismate dehydratase